MGMLQGEKEYEIAVIGAGHAGCEAALACARLGLSTILFTVSMDSVALMPCNPSIGGTSKGHLVREIDALGGEMGRAIDDTFIQSRMLNRSKGPAVRSLRAQADKAAYSMRMRRTLEKTPLLDLRQSEVAEILTEDFAEESSEKETKAPTKESKRNKKVIGVRTVSGLVYPCKAVIICSGTYLKARCVYGEVSVPTGPNGLMAANHLSSSLLSLGLTLRRFKTGTPARIARSSIDFSVLEEQKGDEPVIPFSFVTDPDDVQIEQDSCWIAYTNEETHKVIRENLSRSPLFSGFIEGTGPRYCPSIEDKVVKFPDKERHQIFIEPEGRYTEEMYLSGMSSSLPEDVQEALYHTIKGLEHAHIVRNAYAIEYDCLDARQLRSSLECKDVDGLFMAGQINGSSGYEEAAAQGLIAGINAARKIRGEEPVILDRSQAYIGVLIDDLVTKENNEPYRMMTSRAEYRLLLRQDNADLRLTGIGHEAGLISDERYSALIKKQELIEGEVKRLKELRITPDAKTLQVLSDLQSAPLKTAVSLASLLQRQELNYANTAPLDPERKLLPPDVVEEAEISLKYEGYIERQKKQVEDFKKLEKKRIPADIDYDRIINLRIEAMQKLKAFRPENVGQASRLAGVTPADITVLLIYMRKYFEEPPQAHTDNK